MANVHLYIDDSGTRRPDRDPSTARSDGMDYFALGGILIHEEQIAPLLQSHRDLLARWELTSPLHSTKIRGRRGAFAWLGNDPDAENRFMADLEALILSLPIIGIACVIDRPGYNGRYAALYPQPWLLCKTAFAIIVERAAKYAARHDSKLEIYFEQVGKAEDRAIEQYVRDLRTSGMPFDPGTSAGYDNLKAADFKRIIAGEPNRITKKVPMSQIADLVLYPLAKAGYDKNYPPYKKLVDAKKIIDSTLEPAEVPTLGIKYSCFDQKKPTSKIRRALLLAFKYCTPSNWWKQK
jgi:Protein of unknown function (DUF3800)